jgi:hypothetical protein
MSISLQNPAVKQSGKGGECQDSPESRSQEEGWKSGESQ